MVDRLSEEVVVLEAVEVDSGVVDTVVVVELKLGLVLVKLEGVVVKLVPLVVIKLDKSVGEAVVALVRLPLLFVEVVKPLIVEVVIVEVGGESVRRVVVRPVESVPSELLVVVVNVGRLPVLVSGVVAAVVVWDELFWLILVVVEVAVVVEKVGFDDERVLVVIEANSQVRNGHLESR